MEKKKNKGVIVLIILLILCIIGLVFYILVDKDIIKLNNTTVDVNFKFIITNNFKNKITDKVSNKKAYI